MTAERQCQVEIEPCDELELLNRLPPERAESADVWLAWHVRHVVCWERIAREHPFLADNANYMAEGHWRNVMDLLADPGSRRARRGYWDLGPKLHDLS